MKKPAAKRSRFVRIIKLPIRALSIARDYYVRRMVNCGQVSRYPGAHGVGGEIGLPRSFSVGSSAVSDFVSDRNEDFKELVRVASVRTLAASTGDGGGKVRVLRSKSVGVGMGMGSIDEEDGEDDHDEGETRKLRIDIGGNGGGGGRKQSVVFWRSKSYAVTTKDVAF